MYEYPKSLIDYLTEQESEGSEILTTHIEDVTMWIIIPQGLSKWLVLVTWYEGNESFDQINVCGKGFHKLKKIMNEM